MLGVNMLAVGCILKKDKRANHGTGEDIFPS